MSVQLDWLGYPQIVLGVWAPLVAFVAWCALRPVLRRLRPGDRFRVAVAVGLAPALALCVPYLPDVPLRDSLPWRAPIAWGVSTPVEGTGLLLPVVEIFVLMLLLSVLVSFGYGLASVVRARRTVRRLRPRREGDLLIVAADRCPPGLVACTVGLFRPRILVSEVVLASPHGAAVVAHERAHAAARHPLWVVLATCAIRSWWWLPGRRALLAEVRLGAELAADDEARRVVGPGAVARALQAQLPGPAARVAGVGAGVCFADPGVELEARAVALADPPRRIGRPLAVVIHLATLCGVAAVVLLL